MTKLFSHIKGAIKAELFYLIETSNEQEVLWNEVLDDLKIQAQIFSPIRLNKVLSSLDKHFSYLDLVDITNHKAANQDDKIDGSRTDTTNYFIVYMVEELFYKSPTFKNCNRNAIITRKEAKQLWVEINELTKKDWYHKENVEKLFFG